MQDAKQAKMYCEIPLQARTYTNQRQNSQGKTSEILLSFGGAFEGFFCCLIWGFCGFFGVFCLFGGLGFFPFGFVLLFLFVGFFGGLVLWWFVGFILVGWFLFCFGAFVCLSGFVCFGGFGWVGLFVSL